MQQNRYCRHYCFVWRCMGWKANPVEMLLEQTLLVISLLFPLFDMYIIRSDSFIRLLLCHSLPFNRTTYITLQCTRAHHHHYHHQKQQQNQHLPINEICSNCVPPVTYDLILFLGYSFLIDVLITELNIAILQCT